MENSDLFRLVLELSTVIPAILLCYLPMKGHLNGKGRQIALWGIPVVLLWVVAGGEVCYHHELDFRCWLFPTAVVFVIFYSRTVTMSRWKTVSVFLAVCATFSNMRSFAILIDSLLSQKSGPVVLSVQGAVCYVLLCWLALALASYPATHAARWLLGEIEMAGTWYVFWVIPLIFWGLNVVLRPREYSTLYINRIMKFYPVLVFAFLVLMLLFYALFYWMARGMATNMRLAQENRLLQMQTAQYRILQKSIEDTRRARHDLRQQTDMDVSVQMGEETLIPEPEFCALLGNLLENAIEACAASGTPRVIRLHIRQQGQKMLYLTLDNTSDQPPESGGNRFLSSRHEGFGVGTESVRATARRYNGDARFEWKEGMFYVSVMLSTERGTDSTIG